MIANSRLEGTLKDLEDTFYNGDMSLEDFIKPTSRQSKAPPANSMFVASRIKRSNIKYATLFLIAA